jgi:putative DNA primase/helicase
MLNSSYTIEHLQPDAVSPDESTTPGTQKFETITLGDLVQLKLSKRQQVISPIIPVRGLTMLYAARGIGKTHVALGLSYAVSCGTSFLRWQASEPRRVLYLDGEMPTEALQERAQQIVAASPHQPPRDDYFQLLSMDRQPLGTSLNLAKPEHQAALEPQLAGVELLVIDNVSTLVSGGRENDADSWDAMQAWLLHLRRQGISVLLIHHAGRGENARGTSKREDVLDTVIQLKRPDDYDPEEGARFEVYLTKARGVFGDDAAPFEAKLEVIEGQAHWTCNTLQDRELDQVEELSMAGKTVREIADQTGLSKSKVNRMQMKLRTEGRLRN